MINPVKRSINERVSARLVMAYNGDPWHGKNLKAILAMSEDGLPDRALALVNHMVAWRDFVVDALCGKEGAIKLNSEADWPPVINSEEEILASLEASQSRLLKAISDFDEDKWHTRTDKAECTYLQLVHGLIDHDIYHSGQIIVAVKHGM